MKLRPALTALAFLLGLAAVSHAAQTIVSPGFPTFTNTSGACYLRNVGPRPVSVQVTALLNFSPGFIDPSFTNCNVPIASGQTCVVLVDDLPDDVAFACSAVVAGSPKTLRATAELRQITASGPKTLVREELR